MSNTTAERLAALSEIRTWVRTPFVPQGRLKGIAVDCIGLCVAMARAAQALSPEAEQALPRNYGMFPHGNQLRKIIEAHLVKLPDRAQALAGDLVLVAWRVYPMHLLILADREPGIIQAPFNCVHALNLPTAKKVVEHPFEWHNWRVTGCYRFPRWEE
jgi:hypothetical protein